MIKMEEKEYWAVHMKTFCFIVVGDIKSSHTHTRYVYKRYQAVTKAEGA
jgi:hypothetical protein